MKEVKNKKTGRVVDMLTEEEYSKMLRNAPPDFMKKFIITDIKMRNIAPPIKPTKKKNEG